jgi:hypothetical protein
MGLIKERQGAACYALDTTGRGYSRLETANLYAVLSGESDDSPTLYD